MAKLLTSTQMREADRRTIEELGLPGVVLMENAGQETVRILKDHLAEEKNQRLLILAGAGNNGGDGFVVARRLLQDGIATEVILFGQGQNLKGDAAINHQVYHRLGGPIHEIVQPEDLNGFKSRLLHSGIIVDAIFGTGLMRPITGVIATAIDLVNQAKKPVLAIDIPSGINADDGRIMGTAIHATWTVTFAAEKIGHRLYPGAGLCGQLTCVDIGIPSSYLDIPQHTVARNLTHDLSIPQRPRDSHKGHFGHLFIVAGSVGKEGAAALTALGAQCVGPGLVTVATPGIVQSAVASKLLEAMTLPLPDDGIACIDPKALTALLNHPIRPSALAIGPGLGAGDGTAAVVTGLLNHWHDIPAVIDADGLNALARDHKNILPKTRTAATVLTPHPGEMSRLLGLPVATIQENRMAAAKTLATHLHSWVVLKGADSVIAAPDGRIWINDSGNSGLSAGGSGDVLTGVIAGLLARGWPVESAVRAGVRVHGEAAETAALALGGAPGLRAGELPPFIRRAINRLG
ncbi:MAG: carbohydrate kinase, YjeF related protein [Magnetococcales bacterium]|nr:carbohydrate kinase, YjeF related protein [Magnetococcales bacterium]HIJ82680.1 NAD(P)H-hydrate dehydratase [Magnetococcales bacterium]